MVKIQYISDIHLEFRSIEQVPKLLKNVGADILVLAGDICAINIKEDYIKFIALLAHYSKKYLYILHVAGNHEYYTTARPVIRNDCIDGVNKKLKALTSIFPNYIFLNCDTVTLKINNKPYMFIGATLWTKVHLKDHVAVEARMNDYNYIFTNVGDNIHKFTVADMQILHRKHLLFIKKAVIIAASVKIPTILITHHKSIGDIVATSSDPITQAYETDITDIIHNPVKLVIWGHTHVSYSKIIKNIKFVSNPKGYPNQRTGFSSTLFEEIK